VTPRFPGIHIKAFHHLEAGPRGALNNRSQVQLAVTLSMSLLSPNGTWVHFLWQSFRISPVMLRSPWHRSPWYQRHSSLTKLSHVTTQVLMLSALSSLASYFSP